MPRAKRSSNGGGRPDIRDVARLAQVSIATVSRTMNGVPTVDPELARAVRKAVEELGFRPHGPARMLVSGRSRLLGLIVSEITNPFFPELIQGFEEAAVELGYEILIGSTSYDPGRMEQCVNRMLEREVDGVAVMTFGMETPLLDRLAARGVPLVFAEAAPAPTGPQFSTIEVDYERGICQGVQHLVALGHREIAFISGPLRLHSARARQQAFLGAAKQAGFAPGPEWLPEGDHTLEGGISAMRATLAGRRRPTAVMCSNDMTAIGVLHALYGRSYRAPEDFSVIGFDDVRIAQYTLPPLTSIQLSSRELARRAVVALRRHLEPQDKTPAAKDPVTTSLTVRQTTGAPRTSRN